MGKHVLIIVHTIIPGISIWWKVASVAIASVTSANYCPEAYLILLVVRSLLTLMFTRRSSCIGRLQAEKCVSLFVQG